MFDATYLTKDEVKALIARRDKMVTYFDNLIAQKGREPGALLKVRSELEVAAGYVKAHPYFMQR